jgi:hypothetical protein
LPLILIVPLLTIPPVTVLLLTRMPKGRGLFAPPALALIVPLLVIPPPILALFTVSAALVPTRFPFPGEVTGMPSRLIPGVIVPALTTAPVTVVLSMTIEVVTLTAPFEKVAVVSFATVCPACAMTLPRRSAAAEVVAKSAGLKADMPRHSA